MSAQQLFGNWKIVEGDKTFLKVVGFPVPDDCGPSGESMWVEVVDGTDFDGVGKLANTPAFHEEAQHGDLVRYEGGTEGMKPKFVAVVAPETARGEA